MFKIELNKVLRIRVVGIFIAVIIINGLILWANERNSITKAHSNPDNYKEMWSDITEKPNIDLSSLYEKLDELNGISVFDSDEIAKLNLYSTSLHFEIWLYEEIISEIETSLKFNENIQNIIENTNQLIKKNKDNPTKKRELNAILEKYQGIANIETQIGPSRAITTFVNNKVTDYLAIAIIIFISVSLLSLEYDREWLVFLKL